METIETSQNEPPWLRVARFYAQIDVREIPGTEANPLILGSLSTRPGARLSLGRALRIDASRTRV